MTNIRTTRKKPNNFSFNNIIEDQTITIPVNQEMPVHNGIKIRGQLKIRGDLVSR